MHMTPTRLGVVLAVAAGVLLGAVFGQPGSGRAASEVVPKNKTLPTISGTAEAGQTLTATRGTWSGNPTSFRFSWGRCDTGGNACGVIGGATAKIYTVTDPDVGHTLRVTVTARNASGTAQAMSAPTGIVSPGGCPPGTGTLQIAQLTPPGRLLIGSPSVSPGLTSAAQTIRVHVLISACGRPVQGATVFATPIPYNQFKAASATTGQDGTVTIIETRERGFPAARHQRLLAVFVRASKPGESAVAGVSTSRVVSFRISR
jgi:hypothetical protein